MRSILALSLLVTLGASANAATVHHARHRHAVVLPNQGYVTDPASSFAYAPGGPRVHYQPAPEYSDQPDPTTHWVFEHWGG
jgi:hypothetical protein